MKGEPKERIELTQTETEALLPSLAHLQALQNEASMIVRTIQPFIEMLAKNHKADLNEYMLSPDGKAFIRKQETQA